MAKQAGPIFLVGTRDGFTWYKMEGKFYVRSKSSLSRKRVKRSPRFALTRVHAAYLARGSRIASETYRSLPRHLREHRMYCAITGEVMQLLKQMVPEEEIRKLLYNKHAQPVLDAQRTNEEKSTMHEEIENQLHDIRPLSGNQAKECRRKKIRKPHSLNTPPKISFSIFQPFNSIRRFVAYLKLVPYHRSYSQGRKRGFACRSPDKSDTG